MKRHLNVLATHLFVVVSALAPMELGCAQLESDQGPTVTVPGPTIVATGSHGVVVGSSVAISATTAHGSDTSYTFTSADPTTATVDGVGVVTGIAVGETSVTVTGDDTLATASYPVVVLAPSDAAQIPYYNGWAMSAHADGTALAFNNWNQDGQVPVTCARCHSSEGFIDYIGGDGSAPGVVDKPAPTMSVIRCITCHNPAADALSSVTFPSGVTVDGLGGEARCMTCHQGRSSGPTVDATIAKAAPATDDTVSAGLSFQNIHFFPAAATLYAGLAKGGYEYASQVYDVRFRHVDGYNTCIGCHDPHSTAVKFDGCVTCHTGVTDVNAAHEIRMMSSVGIDYDGDGNTTEGIYDELIGLRDKLATAIQSYASEQSTPICYSGDAYPYWFADRDGDGSCSAAEATTANAFASWTARLMRATYNFQMASKDPGAFAHNAKYIIELLFDSITDLNSTLVVKVDMTKATRTDFGHFDGASVAARHWDSNEQVDASCSSCHGGAEGFRFYVQYGVGKVVQETANGLECSTCHDSPGTDFTAIVQVPSVTFPSGVTRTEPGFDNVCETCHRGRESKATVDAAIAAGKPTFKNVHYLPAGATKLGSAVHVGYEYAGNTYAGPLTHQGGTQCTSCHDPVRSHHTFQITDAWNGTCSVCHADAGGDPKNIRVIHTLDYDGDGNTGEPLAAEIDGLAASALAAMQAVAPAPGLCYAPGIYPYFFKDTDGDKSCSAAEAVSSNGFSTWTAALSKAAFNYQLSRTEPGAWAHNFDYMAELLYDSTADLGGDVSHLKRP
jgi:Cytochrome c7 and related cytochrome c/Doubled CXXCH motif (Paired_CXXCH_1)